VAGIAKGLKMSFAVGEWSKRALLASVCSVVVVGYAHAEAPEAQAPIEEIYVTGIRASLAKSLDMKRDAVGVIDAISAEDIADFPDLNISESLQRITGVTINRTGGEGQRVTVRGLAPQFTRVTVNGQPIMSGNSGREVDFDAFASELFSSVTLAKTTSADMTEGGMAATIDLRTPRPFDFDGFQMAGSLQGSYNDLSEKYDPRGAVLISNTFADGCFGVLFSAAYSERLSRFDTVEGFRWQTRNLDIGANGSVEYPNVDQAIQPRVLGQQSNRERLGLSGALQFKPTDEFEAAVDVLYADFKDVRERYDLQAVMTSPVTPISVVVQNNNVVSGTFSNILQQSESVLQTEPEKITGINLDTKWTPSDLWDILAKGGYSKGEGSVDDVRAVYAARSNISYAVVDKAAVLTSAVDLSNQALYNHNLTVWNQSENENESYSGRIDLGRKFDGTLTRVSGGFEYGDRQLTSVSLAGQFANTALKVNPELYQEFPFKNFLEGFSTPGLLRNFVTVDVSKARNDAATFPVAARPVLNPINSFEVGEKTTGGYIKADLDWDMGSVPVTADIGVRVVRTKQTSQGSQQVGTTFVPITINRDYTDTLPAANVRFKLSDDFVWRIAGSKAMTRPTLLDLSPRQTITPITRRATFGNPNLDPYRVTQFDTSLEWYFANEGLASVALFHKDVKSFVVNVTTQEVVTGNNLFDGNGNNISGQLFDVTKPINGKGGSVKGFELSYQQPFTFLPSPFDGFGMLANYTYADSSVTVNINGVDQTSRIPGQSPNSFNLVGYYEKGPFGIRLAYSWRDDFVFNIRSNARLESEKAYGQLDMSTKYDLGGGVQASFEAINLLRAKGYQYDGLPTRPMVWSDTGRTFILGLKAKM
jgi:TonB-dependent receptor